MVLSSVRRSNLLIFWVCVSECVKSMCGVRALAVSVCCFPFLESLGSVCSWLGGVSLFGVGFESSFGLRVSGHGGGVA